ncbi:hypothetical protein V5799_005947 [Amblyomma americanum]|uniref:Uncharacterized protein n=1 Tax=Amblyomma americanum TaxID=6943 RepID=A0AAQ4DXT2_AMBAM
MAKHSVSAPELGASAHPPVLPSAHSGAALSSASTPEFSVSPSAPVQYSASDTVGPSQSSWLPAMTGTGPPAWWRAPMMNAMLHTGLLTPPAGHATPIAATTGTPEYREPVMPEAASLAMPEHRAPVTPEATMSPMPEYKAPVTTKDVIPAKPEYRRSSRERVKSDMKAPLDRTRSIHAWNDASNDASNYAWNDACYPCCYDAGAPNDVGDACA